MFHNWNGTDTVPVDIDGDTRLSESWCWQCGVTAAEWQYGAPYFVSVSHGVLPLSCEGPTVANPHSFAATGGEDDPLECSKCWQRIDGDTLPDTVDWECVAAE